MARKGYTHWYLVDEWSARKGKPTFVERKDSAHLFYVMARDTDL